MTTDTYITGYNLRNGERVFDRAGRGPWKVVEPRCTYYGVHCVKMLTDAGAFLYFPLNQQFTRAT